MPHPSYRCRAQHRVGMYGSGVGLIKQSQRLVSEFECSLSCTESYRLKKSIMCNQVRAISILQSQEFVHEHPGGCTAEQVTIGVPRTVQDSVWSNTLTDSMLNVLRCMQMRAKDPNDGIESSLARRAATS